MKNYRSLYPFGLLLLALTLVFGPLTRAEETPSAPAEKKETPPPPEQPSTPSAAPAPDAPPTDKVAPPVPASEPAAKSDDKAAADEKNAEPIDGPSKARKGKHRGAIVDITGIHRGGDGPPIGDHYVPMGARMNEVVSICGNSTVDGDVDGQAVSIFGDTTINGSTGGQAVSIFGKTEVNGRVNGQVVAVLGDVVLGPKAVVDGDVNCILGQMERADGAQVHGGIHHIGGGKLGGFTWLRAYFTKCLLLGRLLWVGENLGWAWIVAGCFLIFYLLLALLFPRGIEASVETLEQRPGGTVLTAFLTLLITPFLIVLLVVTGVGIVLIPFIGLAMLIGTLFGKAAVHAWLGRRLAKLFGVAVPAPVLAVLLGSVLIALLYMIPFLGILLWKFFGMLGLGMVIFRVALSMQREKPATVAAVATPPVAANPFVESDASAATPPPPLSANPVPAAVPPTVFGASLPRAGFWIRIAAALLDAILIGILCGFLSSIWHNFGSAYMFWYALYCTAMWTKKGTTIGGIICGLKVVRIDDRPIDWGVAAVRAVGGFLSLAVAGLGFIWVAFDNDKQSWHDKIAGTTIVRVPKGTPLL